MLLPSKSVGGKKKKKTEKVSASVVLKLSAKAAAARREAMAYMDILPPSEKVSPDQPPPLQVVQCPASAWFEQVSVTIQDLELRTN